VDTDLKSQLSADLKRALRTGDRVKLGVIRAVLAAVDKAESDRRKKLVDQGFSRGLAAAAGNPEIARLADRASAQDAAAEDPSVKSRDYYIGQVVMAALDTAEIMRQSRVDNAGVLEVIAREAKQRKESIAAYKSGNRPDLVTQEETELTVLRGYLPQPAQHDDIVAVARQVIAEVGAQGPRDKGKVMPKVIAMLKERADGRQINDVVNELLQ
jgi:uncharacterized protein YqeY